MTSSSPATEISQSASRASIEAVEAGLAGEGGERLGGEDGMSSSVASDSFNRSSATLGRKIGDPSNQLGSAPRQLVASRYK